MQDLGNAAEGNENLEGNDGSKSVNGKRKRGGAGNENQTDNTPDPTGDVSEDEGGGNEAAPTGGGGDPGDYDDPDDSDNGEGQGTPGGTPGGDGARQRRGNELPPPNNLNGVTFERYSKGLDAQKCADSITDMVILSDGVDLKDIYNFSIWREKLVCGILSYVNDKIDKDIQAYLEVPELGFFPRARPDTKTIKFLFGVVQKKVTTTILSCLSFSERTTAMSWL